MNGIGWGWVFLAWVVFYIQFYLIETSNSVSEGKTVRAKRISQLTPYWLLFLSFHMLSYIGGFPYTAGILICIIGVLTLVLHLFHPTLPRITKRWIVAAILWLTAVQLYTSIWGLDEYLSWRQQILLLIAVPLLFWMYLIGQHWVSEEITRDDATQRQ